MWEYYELRGKTCLQNTGFKYALQIVLPLLTFKFKCFYEDDKVDKFYVYNAGPQFSFLSVNC